MRKRPTMVNFIIVAAGLNKMVATCNNSALPCSKLLTGPVCGNLSVEVEMESEKLLENRLECQVLE